MFPERRAESDGPFFYSLFFERLIMVISDLIPTAAKPSLRNPQVRLLGSGSGLAPRPPLLPGQNPPLRPPEAPPAMSAPDIAMQFVPCLESIPVPPGLDLKSQVIDAIIASSPPGSDVRYLCADGSGRIGIWTQGAGTTDVEAARDAVLQVTNILENGIFAIWINASFVRSGAAAAFANQPKRLNEDGSPNDGGPIHLTGMNLDFVAPNQILTTVNGYDSTPWPDVSFTFTNTDTMSVSGGQLQVNSTTNLDVDQSWIDVLLGISAILATFVNPAFYVAALGFFGEGAIIVASDPGNLSLGDTPGSAAAQNVPAEIMIPEGQKLVFVYNGVAVDVGGMTAFGDVMVVPRTPKRHVDRSDPNQR